MVRHLVERAFHFPDVTLVGVVLIALTLIGLFAAPLISASLRRTALFDLLLAANVWCWAAVNGPLEGRTLVTFDPGHGLTLGDLLALPAMLVGVGLAATSIFRRSSHRSGAPTTG
jgi:hypothetical protein